MTKASPRHILVIDDDPDFTDHLKALFEEHGFTVAVALDGEQGLDRVRAARVVTRAS